MTATPSRRAVLRSAAWTVPVVCVVADAPAFAASVQTFTMDYTSPRKTLSPFARRADFVVSNPTGAALVVFRMASGTTICGTT